VQKLKSEIERVLKGSPGDYTELRLEEEQALKIEYKKESLEDLSFSEDRGGIVRTLIDGGWGITTFNSLKELESKVEQAAEIGRTAAGAREEKISLADAEQARDEVDVTMDEDFRTVDLQEKKELIESYNEEMLHFDDQVESTVSRYQESLRSLTYANSEGSYLKQEIPDVTLMLAAVARAGERNIQRAHDSVGEGGGFEVVRGKKGMAREVAERAVNLLSAEPVEGGKYTVILDPKLAGVFIHEAFGHLCEADHIYENDKLKEMMYLGREFGNPDLNVVDDGYIPGYRGNLPYDDEGVKRAKTYLIREGKLSGFLHSRETAAKMEAEPTGNARAISYRHEPIVRMTNTYIESGEASFESLLEGVDKGIYACEAFGGQTQLEQFTFSAAFAYMIEDGEIGDMVRDVVLTGNIFQTLKNVDRIGDDLEIHGSAGGCGKGGQFPLPVTTGAPHVRIKNVTIGGE